MIIYLILLIMIIFSCKHIKEIHKFNYEAVLEQIQNTNKELIFEKLKERKPLLIHNLANKNDNLLNLSFKTLNKNNPGYIIYDDNKYISLKSFDKKNIDNIFIYKNRDIVDHFNLTNDFDVIYEKFKSDIHFNKRYNLSLLKGNNSISCIQNKRNLYLFYQIHGESNLYLINPKHENDILNKINNEIKKYAHKINISSGIVLYIPIQWYFFFETSEDSIIGEIESDNIFTFIYNELR